MTTKKLIVFNFSKRGTAEYAERMIYELLPIISHIYCSNYFSKKIPKVPHIKVFTSTNGLIFILLTVFYLPILLIKILLKYKREKVVFYFPGHHPWNLLIIKTGHFINVRSIATVHDGVLHLGEENGILQKILNSIFLSADYHVYLTDYVKDKMKHVNYNKKSIIIKHPNGLVDNVKHNLVFSKPMKFLFMGRINKYKGVELLIEVFEALGNESIVTIAGEWQGMKPQKQYPENITIINKWLSESEIRKLIESHHFLVLPYLEASQSGVLTIGIDSGIPLIVSNVGGLEEQAADYPCLFFDPSKIGLLNIVKELTSNSEKYDLLKSSMNKYTQGVGKSIISSFESLIN